MGNPDSANGRQEDDSSPTSSTVLRRENAHEGFAQAISALQKLNRLESDIATLISECKVPLKETRKFLRCTTPDQASNVALFQYMRALFMQLGIELRITDVRPFRYTLAVRDSAISNLRSRTNGHTCDLISEAISRFIQRNLNLACDVEEIRCSNAGDDRCEFEATIDKEDFCRVVLSDVERDILRELTSYSGGVVDPKQLSSLIPPEEADFRLDLLRRLELVEEDGQVTELGARFSTEDVEEDDFAPPWREMSEMASAISNALSFAEASRHSLSTESKDDTQEKKFPDTKEVRECRSFAELLAKQIEKESKTEGF